MIQFQENTQTDVRRQGWADPISWDPSSYRQGSSKWNCKNWRLKVKNMEYNVGLTNNYCILVSMQKVSSIHKLIQQILGSHELNDYTHFWPSPPKNHWNNFLLSWICTTMEKISSFHQFILKIQPILESCGQTGHTHFWSHPSKNFLINFWFM